MKREKQEDATLTKKGAKRQSEIKKRAAQAKERLKMGYWTRLAVDRAEFLKKEGDTPENRQRIRQVQRSRYIRENIDSVEDNSISETERLYLRVCNILDNDENTTNPIGQLIDYEKYKEMDENAKQRYVLYLVRQYNELKERYYLERMIKSV